MTQAKQTSLAAMQARDIYNVGTALNVTFRFSSRSNFNPEFHRRFWMDFFPFSKVKAILKDQNRVFVIQFVFSQPILGSIFRFELLLLAIC